MSKHTILWADDDVDDQEIFREVLYELSTDYELKEFTNGETLLNYLQSLDKKDYPCLIILYMNMPVLTGRDTLVMLKNDPEYDHIPVVILTTSINEMDRLYCERYHTAMLTKPPTYGGLKDAVRSLLKHCHH